MRPPARELGQVARDVTRRAIAVLEWRRRQVRALRRQRDELRDVLAPMLAEPLMYINCGELGLYVCRFCSDARGWPTSERAQDFEHTPACPTGRSAELPGR